MYICYRIKFWSFFKHKTGIQKFANEYIHRYILAKGRSALFLENYLNILEEERKKNIDNCKELKPEIMDYGEFLIKIKKTKSLTRIVWVTVLFEIFLNYISTLIFIQGEGLLYLLIRWGLSIILTLSAMLVTDGLLTKILPDESGRRRGNRNGLQVNLNKENYLNIKKLVGLIVLPILLIFVEIAIIGVAHARALDIEGGVSGGILYYGFILLSMALPIIAGYFKWESEHNGEQYQESIKYYQNKNAIPILDSIITANHGEIKIIVENSIRKAWVLFSRFKLYKENYNAKKDLTEDLNNHYAKNFESFREEGLNYFGIPIKKIIKTLEN